MTGGAPRHPVFAWCYDRLGARASATGELGDLRAALAARARGVTVDLGTGTGLNLPLLPPAVTELHLVEPDPHMRRRLGPRVPAGALLHAAGAERLPLPDGSVDTVLTTLTLCTVAAPAAAAAEVVRVLRPGGRLLVLEHVRSHRADVARRQRRLDRPWGWFAGGCHLDRDTGATLAAAGLDVTGLRRVEVAEAPALVGEWLVGDARRTP